MDLFSDLVVIRNFLLVKIQSNVLKYCVVITCIILIITHHLFHTYNFYILIFRLIGTFFSIIVLLVCIYYALKLPEGVSSGNFTVCYLFEIIWKSFIKWCCISNNVYKICSCTSQLLWFIFISYIKYVWPFFFSFWLFVFYYWFGVIYTPGFICRTSWLSSY